MFHEKVSVSESSPCLTLRAAIEAKARLPFADPHMSIPYCNETTGEYLSRQCTGYTGYCWCVDPAGNEIANTRKPPGQGPVDCDKPTPLLTSALTPTDISTSTLNGKFNEFITNHLE